MKFLRTLIAALLVWSAAITPALADSAYRYWSYWNADTGSWQYAKLGPAMTKATDGGVDGWRYGVGTTKTSTPPSIAPDFESICGSTPVGADQVRVAVVIDYGTDAGAPTARSACAVIANGLTRASALAAIAPLRLNQGFVCGIDNFPATGCGEPASVPTRSSAPEAAAEPAQSADAAAVESSAAASPSPSPMDELQTATPTQTPTPAPAAEESSLLPTIVTGILAIVVLVLALRNARLQQEARRK